MSNSFILSFIFFFLVISSSQISYDESIAAKMINISASTYLITPEQAQNKSCPYCYQGFNVVDIIYDIQQFALVGYDAELNCVVAAYRGTKEVSNFVNQADARITPYGMDLRLLVHAGFRDSLAVLNLKGLKKSILSELKRHQNCNIIFTGHGLGGAIANLAATNFQVDHYKKYSDILLYTFGQPRVGNNEFIEYQQQYIRNYFRVVHAKDILPHLPPKGLGEGLSFFGFSFAYEHSGQEIWYSQGMKQIKNRCQGDSEECSRSVGTVLSKYSLDDHDYEQYLKIGKKQKLNDL